MTDSEVNYRAVARQAVPKLTAYRRTRKPAAPRPVPASEKAVKLLAGPGSEGHPDARDQPGAAARRVAKGLRTPQLTHHRPEPAQASPPNRRRTGCATKT